MGFAWQNLTAGRLYSSLPGSDQPATRRTLAALVELGGGTYTEFQAALNTLDNFLLNDQAVTPQELAAFEGAAVQLSSAFDSYLAVTEPTGDWIPLESTVLAVEAASRAVVTATAAIAIAWTGAALADWNLDNARELAAVARVQELTTSYLRASAVQFEAASRGVDEEADTIAMLAEIDTPPEPKDAQFYVDKYVWTSSDPTLRHAVQDLLARYRANPPAPDLRAQEVLNGAEMTWVPDLELPGPDGTPERYEPGL